MADLIQSDADWDETWVFYSSYTSPSVNTPRDLSGFTAKGGLKLQGAAAAALDISPFLSVSTNSVILHVPTANASKEALALGVYKLDIVLVDGAGNRQGGIFEEFENVSGYAP